MRGEVGDGGVVRGIKFEWGSIRLLKWGGEGITGGWWVPALEVEPLEPGDRSFRGVRQRGLAG